MVFVAEGTTLSCNLAPLRGLHEARQRESNRERVVQNGHGSDGKDLQDDAPVNE